MKKKFSNKYLRMAEWFYEFLRDMDSFQPSAPLSLSFRCDHQIFISAWCQKNEQVNMNLPLLHYMNIPKCKMLSRGSERMSRSLLFKYLHLKREIF